MAPTPTGRSLSVEEAVELLFRLPDDPRESDIESELADRRSLSVEEAVELLFRLPDDPRESDIESELADNKAGYRVFSGLSKTFERYLSFRWDAASWNEGDMLQALVSYLRFFKLRGIELVMSSHLQKTKFLRFCQIWRLAHEFPRYCVAVYDVEMDDFEDVCPKKSVPLLRLVHKLVTATRKTRQD
ncbi:hypothetical protein HPB48_000933 [Haemaphysalis longicornis]|uniref:Uncharacterized protein n=1 Tax=Haemaphysalis longicornis TaxID=44386 RepID=A0A9J6GTV9_HAELO|nr:hypothetical protein HPB48_000933 [Haemaphysalis longicornis]